MIEINWNLKFSYILLVLLAGITLGAALQQHADKKKDMIYHFYVTYIDILDQEQPL